MPSKTDICKLLENTYLKTSKIQGTYFKIQGTYFKIYGLYFLQQAMYVFSHRETGVIFPEKCRLRTHAK